MLGVHVSKPTYVIRVDAIRQTIGKKHVVLHGIPVAGRHAIVRGVVM